ncbi:MAG TPA: glycosyltransferase family 4 protein [Paraburkholderia sp.]
MPSENLTIGDRPIEMAFAEPVESVQAVEPAEAAIKVHAHLAVDKDPAEWRRKRESGDLVGINDPTPYGYGRAEEMGCRVTFSKSGMEGRLGKLCRLGVRAILGADLVHAWRNRTAIRHADIVWTHTESQFLAVAMVGVLVGQRIRIIGQSVWLIDSWDALMWPKKALFRWLISRVDVLTFHSPENYARAKALFPAANVRLVKFGIPAETKQAPVERRCDELTRILAIGNDRHRDWKTLIDAVRGMLNVRLKILSGSLPKGLVKHDTNIEVMRARSNDELRNAFDEATLVCVPLKKNFHASGLTVVQEAVLSGVPVVATDIGGLSAYFSADEIRYVPPGDAAALRAAFEEIAQNPGRAREQAMRAQARMEESGDIGAQPYIRRHVALSREILKRDE